MLPNRATHHIFMIYNLQKKSARLPGTVKYMCLWEKIKIIYDNATNNIENDEI